MRLATVKVSGTETAAVVHNEKVYLLNSINQSFGHDWKTGIFELIQSGELDQLKDWYEKEGKQKLVNLEGIPVEEVKFGPLYRHPRKIWGIGLNYVDHAADLNEVAPDTEPASFMKPDTTIIGPGDKIKIPHQSDRTTAEAELGIIIGKVCKNVSEEEAINHIAGFTTIIDMTAEDILQKNPRYLTRSKSFDTFFSFGPELVTVDEVHEVNDLEVATVINGQLHRKNVVSNMTFRPWFLVSFHSKVMTLLPGDIISTGTPGAVVLRDGDVVSCEITGFRTLVNPVIDLKVKR